MPRLQETVFSCLRYTLSAALAAALAAAPAAAQQRPDLNARQVTQELETVAGLLKTTVKVVTQAESPAHLVVASSVSVESYYLPSQGAVFILTVPVTLRTLNTEDVVLGAAKLRQFYELRGKVMPGAVAKPDGEPQNDQPELTIRERLQEAQKQQLERKKDLEELRNRGAEQLEKVRGFLLETVADYGDRLSHLQAGEYVNLVLTTSSNGLRLLSSHGDFGLFGPGNSADSRQIVSIPVSLIKDYKAGRRSLEELKAQVVVY